MNRSSCPPSPPRRSRGFTLLEMLLALALVGMLMVGLNTFVFSMSEIWGRNREPRLFDQHVRAVTRYLESELRTAGLPPAIDAETPALYLAARNGCDARLNRSTYAQLAEIALDGGDDWTVESQGVRFSMVPR